MKSTTKVILIHKMSKSIEKYLDKSIIKVFSYMMSNTVKIMALGII